MCVFVALWFDWRDDTVHPATAGRTKKHRPEKIKTHKQERLSGTNAYRGGGVAVF